MLKMCVLTLTASVLLTACGSSLSLTKRQHNKGYHVSMNKKYTTTPQKENILPVNETLNEFAVATENERMNASQEEFGASSSIIANDPIRHAEATSETPEIVEQKVEVSKSTALSSLVKSVNPQPRLIESAKSKVTSTISAFDRGSRGSGYSLLWVIIIVLIILWALGLIGGYGSSAVLHLLLVIALILLILWLLRVI